MFHHLFQLYKLFQQYAILLADSSFCWAFALSTMIRHSLRYFLGQLAKEQPMRFDSDKIYKAKKFLNHLDFHKRLRIGYQSSKVNFKGYRRTNIPAITISFGIEYKCSLDKKRNQTCHQSYLMGIKYSGNDSYF